MNLRIPPRYIVLGFTLGLFVAGCGDNQDPAGSRQLWTDLQVLDYRNFPRAPGYETREPSNAPHGDEVDIYINEILAQALESEGPITAWPEGALVVKDGFESNGCCK